MAEPLRNIIDAGWAEALEPVADRIAAMGEFLRAEVAAGRRYLPAGENVLRAFKQPFDEVRVLIVGQDPYPTPGHPVGLSFSVAPEVRRLPPSLVNIFTEYSADLGYPRAGERGPDPVERARRAAAQPGAHRPAGQAGLAPGQGLGAGDRAGHPGAGRPAGDAPGGDLVGPRRADARAAAARADVPCIESAHPSPNSAHNGFFGSRPFSRANRLLEQHGAEPVDWKLP